MKDQDPLDLSALHSEVPLTDFDYAAIRANVHAKIAERRTVFPWWRVAVAAMAVVVVIAVLVMPRKQDVDVVIVNAPQTAPLQKHTPTMIARESASTPPLAPLRGERVALSEAKGRVRGDATVTKTPKPKPNPVAQLAQHQEPMRIELQTADPEIRIIWIVQPETPTENS